MGIADSPLRDRVIFVEGAPRSGTSFLLALLASHPQIAGIGAESHLFENGLGGIFDNHEATPASGVRLGAYLPREKLVDLVRELGDGVLTEMHSKTKPGARFVVEKTPAMGDRPGIALARKLECYPDAWYVHIVRERAAVARSLLRSPWRQYGSMAAGKRAASRFVEAIRATLGEHSRYLEVRYEELAHDPVETMAELFAWLGLDYDEEARERIGRLSQRRFADLGPANGSPEPALPPHDDRGSDDRNLGDGAASKGLARRSRRSFVLAPARRLRRAVRARGPTAVAQAFAKGFREGDAGTLEALSVPDLELTVRASGEDLRLEGARAIAELVALARSRFGERPFSERWLAVASRAKAMVAFVGSAPDGSRLDLLLTLLIRRRRVARVLLIAAGDREGGIGSPAGAADDSSREVAWSSPRSSTRRGAAG